MNRNTAQHYRNPTEFRRDHYARRDQFQRETVLPIGAALIIIVLSSLGLWWAILSAVRPLASSVTGVGRTYRAEPGGISPALDHGILCSPAPRFILGTLVRRARRSFAQGF